MVESKRKSRSPSYPRIGLAEAIQKIRIIYETQRQYPTDRETMAKTLGYRGLSGASIKVISGLSQYGLIEGQGDSVRVSDVGQELSLYRSGDSEYYQALSIAAVQPPFFRELQETYPEGLPSDHALRAQMTKRGFGNSAIEPAVNSFRETMDLLRTAESAMSNREAIPVVDEQNMDSPALQLSQSDEEIPQTRTTSPALRTITLPLRGAAWAELSGPFPVSEEAWDLMISVLQAMKPALTAKLDSEG